MHRVWETAPISGLIPVATWLGVQKGPGPSFGGSGLPWGTFLALGCKLMTTFPFFAFPSSPSSAAGNSEILPDHQCSYIHASSVPRDLAARSLEPPPLHLDICPVTTNGMLEAMT